MTVSVIKLGLKMRKQKSSATTSKDKSYYETKHKHTLMKNYWGIWDADNFEVSCNNVPCITFAKCAIQAVRVLSFILYTSCKHRLPR